MRQRISLVRRLAVFLLAGLLLVSYVQFAAAQDNVSVFLVPQNNSTISGTATLIPSGNQTQVAITLKGQQPGTTLYAGIYNGICYRLQTPVVYSLNAVAGATPSNTTINVSLSALQSNAKLFAVAVFASPDDPRSLVSCGDILYVPSGIPSPSSAPPASNGPSRLPRMGDPLPIGSIILAAGIMCGIGYMLRRQHKSQ